MDLDEAAGELDGKLVETATRAVNVAAVECDDRDIGTRVGKKRSQAGLDVIGPAINDERDGASCVRHQRH